MLEKRDCIGYGRGLDGYMLLLPLCIWCMIMAMLRYATQVSFVWCLGWSLGFGLRY
ncbi:hypothetical protein BJY00DRAFT_282164 [Aspergillus carlsbadensis]|nr:hypothetical protein BJY00DRAFT_282164 [Aspergillus carlsbadensis]